jgi:hypothetical protein
MFIEVKIFFEFLMFYNNYDRLMLKIKKKINIFLNKKHLKTKTTNTSLFNLGIPNSLLSN